MILRKRRPYRRWVMLLILMFFFFTALLILDRRVLPALFSIVEVEVTQMAVEAINATVQREVTRKDISYSDFIRVHSDRSGGISYLQVNTLRMNQMAADITLAVQKRLRQLEGKSIAVPLGQVLGSHVLAYYGPRISVRIVPMGTVEVEFDDSFEQAGINQTRHKIYLVFQTMVRVVVPLRSGEVRVATRVPLAESVIVGEVPEVVVNFPDGILGSGGLK